MTGAGGRRRGSPPTLQVGLTARSPAASEAEDATAVLRAAEAAATGESYTTVGDIRSDWNRPSFNLAADALLVLDTGSAVAYADQADGRAWVAVRPDQRGRGIGSWLLAWTEAHAVRHGLTRVGQTLADRDDEAVDLLRANGYAPRWDSWVFTVALDPPPPPPSLPAAMVVRPMVRPDEDAAVHRVVEDAFAEWPDRDSGTTLEDWRAAHLDRDDVTVLVVVDDGRIVGVAVCLDEGEGEGWVEQLAVAGSHRGRGLGRALLQASFALFRSHGCTTVGLSTDSRTGAKALYEHVGMAVTESFTRWSKDLPPPAANL